MRERHFRTVLLTGATGFLGSHVARALLRQHVKLYATARDSSSFARVLDIKHQIDWIGTDGHLPSRARKLEAIDCIVHCATNYGRGEATPISTIESNLILPLQLLETTVNNGLRCFINTDTYLDKGINHYSLSKKQFAEWLESYKERLVCINVVLEHFYGPGDNKTKFVTWLTDQLLEEVETIPLTAGQQRRDFIYIDDVVAGFLAIFRFAQDIDVGFHRFDVGSGTPISIRHFAELAKVMTGNSKTVLHFGAIPYRPSEVMDATIDIRALTALGWNPTVGLTEGLSKTIAARRTGK
ncbi:MAG: NAD(P)-dependent oxidoreductase [Betaproteobacteria bacterium]|nr:MAG: NAD(P)-dependent oxidoreductase [Betaproteobacteria bacterium]